MKVLGVDIELPVVWRSERRRIEAKSPDEWYGYLMWLIRQEDVEARWWTPDPQTLH
jgi:hypothetical protein